MPDVADFAALFSSLQVITNLTKFMIDARDASVIRAKAIELQREIIATQQGAIAANLSHSAMLDRVRQLEKEVADLKAWDAEREKYKLTKMSQCTDVLGYALKEQRDPTEPVHFLCANCFEGRIKSILQREKRFGRNEVLFCPRCRTELFTQGHPTYKPN
jgi:uncharacterized protein YcgI (DUF1989 family)